MLGNFIFPLPLGIVIPTSESALGATLAFASSREENRVSVNYESKMKLFHNPRFGYFPRLHRGKGGVSRSSGLLC